MNNVHGMIFAYAKFPELGELGANRTAAAMPICGRYRLIDFPLSSMMNAGISNVDVLMQLGYQSLIDHMVGGRPWNMVRHSGGLHLMPVGLGRGPFIGTMDALENIQYHLEHDINEEYIVMMRGGMFANIDLSAAIEAHFASGADVTAICTKKEPPVTVRHNRFVLAEDGVTAKELHCRQYGNSHGGVISLATYIMRRDKLIEMLNWCVEGNRPRFHRNAMLHFMEEGMKVNVFMHQGYARIIGSVQDYYETNMDMLKPELLAELFPPERPVATRARTNVSSYYSDSAKVRDSLLADGCIIEGELERCVVFAGARVEAGAKLKNCILMNDAVIGKGASVENAILDKYVTIAPDTRLEGDSELPLVVPKGKTLGA